MFHYLLLFISGVGGGFLMGLLGVGGGIVYITSFPFILSKMEVPSHEIVSYTIANSVFSVCLAAFWGIILLIKQKDFYPKEVASIGIPAVVASFLVLKTIVYSTWYSIQHFNVVVICILLYILFKIWSNVHIHQRYIERNSRGKYLLAGLAGGTISSLGGLGGSTILIPLLSLWLAIDIKKAKAISIGVTFLTSLGISFINLFEKPTHELGAYTFGYIVFPIVVPVVVGIMFAVPLGEQIGRKISSRSTTIIFSIFILLVIITKLIALF